MQIVKSYTGTTSGAAKRFITFEFNTGCKMTRFEGGREIFQQKGNRYCRKGSTQIQQMREAVKRN